MNIIASLSNQSLHLINTHKYDLTELYELIQRPNYIDYVSISTIEIPTILGTYKVSERQRCSVCACDRKHLNGRVFQLANGEIFLAGDICAKKHFGLALQVKLNEYDSVDKFESLKKSLKKHKNAALNVDVNLFKESEELDRLSNRFFEKLNGIFEYRIGNGNKLSSYLDKEGELKQVEKLERFDPLSREVYFRFGNVFLQSVPNLKFVEVQASYILSINLDEISIENYSNSRLRNIISKAREAEDRIEQYLRYKKNMRNFLSERNWNMFVEWFELVTCSKFEAENEVGHQKTFEPLMRLKASILRIANR